MIDQPEEFGSFRVSHASIQSAQHCFLFKDLPNEAQENLIRLQYTDGDFLRLKTGATAGKVILVLILALGFVLFLSAFEFSEFGVKAMVLLGLFRKDERYSSLRPAW